MIGMLHQQRRLGAPWPYFLWRVVALIHSMRLEWDTQHSTRLHLVVPLPRLAVGPKRSDLRFLPYRGMDQPTRLSVTIKAAHLHRPSLNFRTGVAEQGGSIS
jgi:hypothetical protein